MLKLKYFVMKPSGSNEYARASRAGIHAYAQIIRDINPNLASDLIVWLEEFDGIT